MRQEQERFRSFDRGVDINPPRRWNPIDTSVSAHPIEPIRRESVREVSFSTNQEDNNGERGEEDSRKADDRKADGFEPFLNQEFKEEDLFVNNYGGNFSQKMELNRRRVERALQIAHLDGKVFLTNLQPSRSRAEAQGNELAAKRFLLFENKTQKAEEENPYRRVVSVPEGWRIEVNDRRITEELTEKKLSGKKLQRTFINRFNGQLKEALKECVRREKLTSEKYREYVGKLLVTLCAVSATILSGTGAAIYRTPNSYAAFSTSLGLNLLTFYMSNDNLNSLKRSTDNIFEAFLPPLEIDRVARTFAYLAGKGRTLVREIKEK